MQINRASKITKVTRNEIFFKKKLKGFKFLKLIKIIIAIKYSNKTRIPVILILMRNAVKKEIKIIFLMVIFLPS